MSFEKPEEKRRFHRIIYDAEAILQNDQITLSCKIVDLSLKGCLVRFDEPWNGAVEAFYTLTLKLTDEVDIVMGVEVAHVIGTQVGFKCRHIDIDSISRLRRLVELNLGDSDLLERELAALSDLSLSKNH